MGNGVTLSEVEVWAFRLEDSPSGFPLQVLAVASSFLLASGSGLSGPIPNADVIFRAKRDLR
jgi:hypothetical protein